jgi:transposase
VGQSALFQLYLEDLVPADHACRVIDAFVENLDVAARSAAAAAGRPGCDPRDLLRLYLYGCLQLIRSSRRLETECRRSIELAWLLGRLVPGHEVINERAKPEAMRLRRCTVERPFAELKERLFGRRFRLRGLQGARCELALAVVAFNLRRLMNLLGAGTLIGPSKPA